MTIRVVFVCTGNTCRSPMAEMLFNHRVTERLRHKSDASKSQLDASSAGTVAIHGQPAARSAIRVLREHGIRVEDHQSMPFESGHAGADLVITMTKEHKERLVSSFPELKGRVFTLREYAYGSETDVADPYMQGDEAYLRAYREIDDAVIRVIDRLLEEHGDVEKTR